MTKKTFLMILCLTAVLSLTSVNVFAYPVGIELQVGYDDPIDGDEGQQRGPVLIPEISLDVYSIIFDTPCDGCTLRLVDANDNVVYSTIIPTGATSIVLPSSLSGEYEIQIIQGNLCFYGYITL
jgi:hypothetical protein